MSEKSMKVRWLAGAAFLASCLAVQTAPAIGEPTVSEALRGLSLDGVSDAALSTSAGPLSDYETSADAVKAGDMAAFVALIRRDRETGDAPSAYSAMILAMDRAAAEDYDGARSVLDEARLETPGADLPDYLNSWILALEGDGDAAIETHRGSADALPGLTADLSLAAMLEGLGREEEALAVYASITPGEIKAPEHAFDPQNLVFRHVQTVIGRRTLLLRRLDRIDEAKAVYEQLAAAEPEQAVRYEAALESLETGRGLDIEPLTPATAFARSIADLSMSLYHQRIIRAALANQRIRGFDDQRSSLDQMALLLDPSNEALRQNVIQGLYQEALYDGAAHVAANAPEPSATIEMGAGQALLMAGRTDEARDALKRAQAAADDDEAFDVALGTANLFSSLYDEKASISAAREAADLAENDAERASANGVLFGVYDHFAKHKKALETARAAQEIDDTHDRRLVLATALGDAGQVDEGLKLLRRERLSRPNDPYMLNSLGYYMVTMTDKYAEGYKILARAVALAENDPYIGDSFGWARFKLGDFEGALRYIEAARDELLPLSHWEIDDHLGDIYWALDREDDAKAAWRRALTTFPPVDVKASLEDKLENGLNELPEKQKLPDLSLQDSAQVKERDI
ncbi:MAG: hypothetical protein AAFQ67_03365 [Pseudomonadota bacterium]